MTGNPPMQSRRASRISLKRQGVRQKIEMLFTQRIQATKQPTSNTMPQIEIDGWLMEQCDHCGNIWDGNAQCLCWQMNDDNADELAATDSGYESE